MIVGQVCRFELTYLIENHVMYDDHRHKLRGDQCVIFSADVITQMISFVTYLLATFV